MDKVLEFFQGDELASKVWRNKYKFGDEQTPKDMFERHIKEIAEKEFQRLCNNNYEFLNLSDYGQKRLKSYFENGSNSQLMDKITENLRKQLNFDAIVLGGSPMQGIGNHKMFSSLSNCFFVGRPYDSYSGINRKEDEIAQLMKRRGGAGIDLSSIRPNGAKVHNQASTSSGVVPFAEGYSAKTKQVAQYGRRGALMISLCMQHPDSLEFIMSKQQSGVMTGANISVIIPDDFMEAVNNNSDYLLRFPVDLNIINESIIIEDFNYNELYIIDKGIYIKKIRARDYWNTLITCAHKTAEPGILFSGNWMKGGTDWVYEQFRPIGTNPCFTGDMMLLTEDGEESFYDLARKCEVEFKERGKFCLNLINKENEIVPGRVWQTGMKHIITLQLDNGKIISCTPNHIFLADGQECEAGFTEGKFLNGFDEDYRVNSIIDNGEYEIVYDFELKGASTGKCSDNDDICHWGIVQNVIAHNCSEIPMSEYDACRLLARNLYTLVKNPFTLESELLSDDELYSAFYEQMIIGDLLVDLEFDYIDRIIEKIKCGTDPEDLKQSEIDIWLKIGNKAKQGRRCGAGFTGFGDMLASLGLPYYSPEVTEKVFKIKMKAELDATIDMSIQFGAFEGFDKELEKNAIYNLEVIAKEFPEQYERMLEFGRRNVAWSTGAPVGTGSMMVQTTSGVEPLFLPFLERKLKCILPTDRVDYIDPADGQAYSLNYVMHPKFITWYIEYIRISIPNMDLDFIKIKTYLEGLDKLELDLIFGLSPWFGSCANDINYHKRVEIQSIVQKYTTHAISSTINLPNDIEVETIGNIYMESWKLGLKGNTVYRDGSRSGIINSISEKDKKEIIENDFEPIKSPKRPKIIPAHYHTLKYKKKTYSVILGFYKERPFEIFIISGINDIPEVFDEMEDFILGETVKDNENWYNFESDTFTVREISDVEGEEKMLSLMLSGLFRSRTPMNKVIKILDKLQPIAGSFTHRLIKILSHYIDNIETNDDELCPECHEKLRHENGCVICINGHSKC